MVAKAAISPSSICTGGIASTPVISHSRLVSPIRKRNFAA